MIEIKNISKEYEVGDQKIKALDKVNFTIEKGKFTVILGTSGSGKSTLLNILGGMDRATSGTYLLDNHDVTKYSDKVLSKYRRNMIGFIFQFYNLIPSLTVLENVEIAANLVDNKVNAEKYLKDVGLLHRKYNFPNQISGGEMQRVSIARALAKKPKLLLCDEPTGALDSVTGNNVIELLRTVAEEYETTVIMVTHNTDFAKMAHQVIHLHDGKVASIEINDN